MSSEIYELMKRSDEVDVVEKAHRRPRFVEDCVREMIAAVVRDLDGLDGESFVSARQENLETIHQHNVLAERHGLLSELRGEIATGTPAERQTSLEQWLDAGVEPQRRRLSAFDLLHPAADAEEVVQARQHRHEHGRGRAARRPTAACRGRRSRRGWRRSAGTS